MESTNTMVLYKLVCYYYFFNTWKNPKVSKKLATPSEWTDASINWNKSVMQQNGIEMKQQNWNTLKQKRTLSVIPWTSGNLPPNFSQKCLADSCIGPSDSTAMGWKIIIIIKMRKTASFMYWKCSKPGRRYITQKEGKNDKVEISSNNYFHWYLVYNTHKSLCQSDTIMDDKSHSEAWGKRFSWAHLGIILWILLFKTAHSGVLYISDRWQGPPQTS